MPAKTVSIEQFGEAFFRRFYLNPKTRVVTGKEMIRRADLIAAFANHGELQVRSILDVGCGLGLMRDQLLRHFPRAGRRARPWRSTSTTSPPTFLQAPAAGTTVPVRETSDRTAWPRR